ncbi:MAG: ABC transporter permease [Bacteroidota bacterium]|nr:ABC transporter permease [Bacteroidota bacterium]MDP4230704.1 ABC transporter permease [Bacteroidota bacterium]MDP4237410.1 ABC transporter permease [Bacteroidota bacterium]
MPRIHFHRHEEGTLLRISPTTDGEGILTVSLGGAWRYGIGTGHPSTLFDKRHSLGDIEQIIFIEDDLKFWDSSLISFIKKTQDEAKSRNISVDLSHLSPGIQRLLALAGSIPALNDQLPERRSHSMLLALGFTSLRWTHTFEDTLEFIGDLILSFGRFFRGKANFRKVDFLQVLRDCSANSLPIVTLISFLFGVILAFIGAAQLKMFGAEIYVADLVGIAMAREMGPMMTAIILAGRCGAAFAAQIGTMTVNEEVDALRTTGISPIDFLVLPRVFSLAIMTPFLALYAVFFGIIGGAVIAQIMLGISFTQFLTEAQQILTPLQFALGIIKSFVYGVLVAFSGCLYGIHCGKSASAVGTATTSAVVMGIVSVVMAAAVMTYIYNVLGV